MKYSSRFFLYAPLAILLGIAAWAMGYWWVVAGALDKKLTALNGHEVMPGISMSYASKTISGFPFNIDVVFTGFKISGAGARGPFAWTTGHFALHRLTYGRTQDIYEAAGTQELNWTDEDHKEQVAKFLPGSLHASAITDTNGLARFDLDVADVSGTEGRTPFTAARLQFHLRRDPKFDGLDLAIMADAVKWPDADVRISNDYFMLTHGAIWRPLLAGKASWPATVKAWEDSNGLPGPDPSHGRSEFAPDTDHAWKGKELPVKEVLWALL